MVDEGSDRVAAERGMVRVWFQMGLRVVERWAAVACLRAGVDPCEDGGAGAAEEADVLEALRGEDDKLQPRRSQFVGHFPEILRQRRRRQERKLEV